MTPKEINKLCALGRKSATHSFYENYVLRAKLATHSFYEVKSMCYNCGCHIPDDDMGHPDNITTTTFQTLAATLKLGNDSRKAVYDYLEAQTANPDAPKNNDIEEMFLKASKAWGQSVAEAKKQTYNMLKSEL